VRSDQYEALSDEQKRWATRLDTTAGARSDWLHEREWRIPVSEDHESVLTLPREAVAAILVEPPW